MQYNYFDMVEMLEKNAAAKLPADINSPVMEHFKDNSVVLSWIKKVQDHVQFARLEIVPKDRPGVRIVIQATMGMIEGYDKIIEISDNSFHIVECTHVKNRNLSKKKKTKKGGENAESV